MDFFFSILVFKGPKCINGTPQLKIGNIIPQNQTGIQVIQHQKCQKKLAEYLAYEAIFGEFNLVRERFPESFSCPINP